MQLKIIIHLDNSLTIPISYHHLLQAIIYKLMGDSNGLSALHDSGKQFGKRTYKLFTFSLIEGKYRIQDKKITFFDIISFEVRSFDDVLIKQIEDNALRHGIQFGQNNYTKIECICRNEHITKDSILINMISPVCIHKTIMHSNYTNYLNPSNPDFAKEINNNFIRKYKAAEIEDLPLSSEENYITISPVRVSQKDKYITIYKDTIIEAYRGIYVLSGKVEYLDFLYNVGIGSKNSQGFGMFNLFKNTQ